MKKIPFLYQKILELDDFKKSDLELDEFQKLLLNFRISKKDWLTIARDLNGFGLVDISDGKVNQHTKISLRRKARL